MTKLEQYLGQQLADYADGDGDMAHDVLYRVQEAWIREHGPLPEMTDE